MITLLKIRSRIMKLRERISSTQGSSRIAREEFIQHHLSLAEEHRKIAARLTEALERDLLLLPQRKWELRQSALTARAMKRFHLPCSLASRLARDLWGGNV